MKRLVNCSFFVVLMLALFAPATSFARPPRAIKPKASATPASATITSVGPSNITIADGPTTKSVGVTQFTEIYVDGQRASFANLRAGMSVEVAWKDGTTANRITAMSAAPSGAPARSR